MSWRAYWVIVCASHTPPMAYARCNFRLWKLTDYIARGQRLRAIAWVYVVYTILMSLWKWHNHQVPALLAFMVYQNVMAKVKYCVVTPQKITKAAPYVHERGPCIARVMRMHLLCFAGVHRWLCYALAMRSSSLKNRTNTYLCVSSRGYPRANRSGFVDLGYMSTYEYQ